jgi:hypothetical protein
VATYWPGNVSGTTSNLVCPATGISPNQPSTPTINFVASLAPSEDPSSCVNTDPVGTCNSINALSTETGAYGTTYPVTPPMPVTIVGSGFGYPGETLPYVAPNPAYLQIQDDGKSTGGTTAWSTNGTTGINGGQASNCQVYIANWSDASISLVINAPIKAYNLYLPTGDYLSPLSDFSPLTLYFPSPNGYNSVPETLHARTPLLAITSHYGIVDIAPGGRHRRGTHKYPTTPAEPIIYVRAGVRQVWRFRKSGSKRSDSWKAIRASPNSPRNRSGSGIPERTASIPPESLAAPPPR